jgi:hypothetical protein
VPQDEFAPSIGDQLADALEASGVNQSELARRLSRVDGATVDSKRRWILKVLNDEIDAPEMAQVAAALSLPRDHFAVPTPQQTQRRRVRLEELAAEVARDREAQLTFAEGVLARLAALEAGQAHEAQQSAQQEKPGEGKAS